jgi:peptide-methionine (R)-S-oxide reductase
MNRERFLASLLGLAALPLTGCSEPTDLEGGVTPDLADFPVQKTAAEWRALLSAAQFAVLFQGWTEEPGSSPLTGEHREGTYLCAACLVPLFRAALKYDSGTGWPTFSEPLDQRLGFMLDLALTQPRTEYHCARCGGHQGHVFDDGPPPGGKRYCNNGLALRFVPAGDALPEPRS